MTRAFVIFVAFGFAGCSSSSGGGAADAPAGANGGGSGASAAAGGGGSAAAGGSAGGGLSAGGGSSAGGGGATTDGGAGGGSTGSAGGGGSASDGGSGGDGGAPAASACTAKMLFCEDFEAVALGNATSTRWTPSTSNGQLTVDTVHAYGARALHVHTSGNGFAYIKPTTFAPPGNSFFGRVRLWTTAYPTAPDYAHFTMVEAAGVGAGLVRPIGGQFIPAPTAGRSLWGVGSDGGPTGDWTSWKTTTPTAAAAWVCLEWQMDASNNAVNVWIDGVAKPELGVSTKVHGGNAVDFVFPTFNSIWFGWWLYQSGSTPSSFDLWLDDIALDTQRLGC